MGRNDTSCLFYACAKISRPETVNEVCLSTEHTANALSIVDKRDQTACKPGSVPPPQKGRGGHSSGPVLAGRFSRPTRTSRAGEGPAAAFPPRRDVPIRSCSRRGLPCRPRRRVRGGLLPHPFTLTCLRSEELRCGGLLSVALSLGSPPAGVTRRLFAVEPGLSSAALAGDSDRPAV